MDFSSMSGWDFERYCADCLLKKGFTKAEVTSGSGDHGVDIIAEQNGIRFGIQCKLYQGQIPNKAVQEAYTGASYYDCDVAVIMSNSELTNQAQAEAKKLRVKFWNIVDYISDTTLKPATASFLIHTKIETYEDYCAQQKNHENQLEQQIEKDTLKRKNVVLAVNNPYESDSENIRLAKALLKQGCLCQSILYFSKGNNSVCYSKNQLLLQKLSYIRYLNDALSQKRNLMKFTFAKQCLEIDRELKLAAEDEMTMEQEEFNQKYWHVRYIYEQFRSIVSKLSVVINSFTTDDLIKIEDLKKNGWYRRHTVEEDSLYELRNQLDGLLEEWKQLFSDEFEIWKSWYFWKNDVDITTEIQQHKQLVLTTEAAFTDRRKSVYEKFAFDRAQKEIIRERQIFGTLLQELLVERCKEQNFERAKQKIELQQRENERILRERQEAAQKRQERLIKEQQDATRRKQEWLSREKREKEQREQERRLKAKQEVERKELIQSLAEQYRNEYQKINFESSAKRTELENSAENEINQAQKQISEFLKQKEAFTLFRKKRDSELDSKIATLSKHIEKVKLNLAFQLTICEQTEEKRKQELRMRILNEAEKNEVKNGVKRAINC